MSARRSVLRHALIAAALLVVCSGLYVHTQVISPEWLFRASLAAALFIVLVCGYFAGGGICPGSKESANAFTILVFMAGFSIPLVMFIFPACNLVRDAHIHSQLITRMMQVGKAMHAYADKHNGRLPPPAIYGKEGQALLSWRMALLPYLGQDDLYRRFRLDEPWDSPHNLPLAAHMPEVYALPSVLDDRDVPNTTYFQVFVGPGTAFEGKKGVSLQDFPDGQSSTLLFAVAEEPVVWTRPADLDFDSKGPAPKLRSIRGPESPSYYKVMFADGFPRSLPFPLTDQELHALITRNGGETVPTY
jgi:hypothetical protein